MSTKPVLCYNPPIGMCAQPYCMHVLKDVQQFLEQCRSQCMIVANAQRSAQSVMSFDIDLIRPDQTTESNTWLEKDLQPFSVSSMIQCCR